MISYKVREFFDIPYHLRKVKWMYQRIKYGVSDRDTWAFDSHLTKVISEGMRKLAVQAQGCPNDLYDEKKKGDECIKWRKILLDIAEGFESKQKIIDDEIIDYSEADALYDNKNPLGRVNEAWGKKLMEIQKSPKSKRLIKKHEAKWDKAIALFKEYYGSFWD